jgi:hypothetical protein
MKKYILYLNYFLFFTIFLNFTSCSTTKKDEKKDEKEIYIGTKTVSGELLIYNKNEFMIDGIFLDKNFFMKDGIFNRDYEYLFNKFVNVHGDLWERKCEKGEICFMGGSKYYLKNILSIELKDKTDVPIFFEGSWIVDSIAGSSPLSTIKRDEAEGFLRKIVRFEKERFISDNSIFSEVEYALKTLTKTEETEFLLEKIKFLTPKIVSVKVLKNKKHVESFGSTVFPRGGNELVVEWKGFYFILKKR